VLCSTDSADDRLPDALFFIAGIDSRNNAGSQVRSTERDLPEFASVVMECLQCAFAASMNAISHKSRL
jgi:hypothetical protein